MWRHPNGNGDSFVSVRWGRKKEDLELGSIYPLPWVWMGVPEHLPQRWEGDPGGVRRGTRG